MGRFERRNNAGRRKNKAARAAVMRGKEAECDMYLGIACSMPSVAVEVGVLRAR